MKSLSVLLALKKEKHDHVMLGDNGVYTGMTTGSKGIVKVTDEAIAHELFGEYPLSEENAANFRLLQNTKLAKVKKSKETKSEAAKVSNNLQEVKKQPIKS